MREVLTRGLSRSESSTSILVVGTVAMVVGGAGTAPLGWDPVTLTDIGLIGLAGALLAVSHYLLIESLRYGEVGAVMPFRYTTIIWAVLWGFLVFGSTPDAWIGAGALLVIASGIYILHHEVKAPSRLQHTSSSDAS